MNSFIALIFILLPTANALEIEVVGKNRQILFHEMRPITLPSTVGHATVKIFNEKSVPYKGGDFGMAEIFGMGQTEEVISNTEMKAYGWCFAIDDFVPETMPDQTAIPAQESKIRWYYAFSHYKDGVWISQCEESK